MKTKTKRKYGKMDLKILERALGQNKTKVEAGRLAGLVAKEDKYVINTVNYNLKNNEELKKGVVERLEAHRDRIMSALEGKDLSKDASGSLNLMMCQTVDKIQLLRGEETERIGIRPDFVIDRVRLQPTQPNPPQIEENEAK